VTARLGLTLASLLTFASVTRAQPSSYGQYLLVLDDSGSMNQSDPQRLVLMAALAFVAGLDDADQAMVVGLGELASGEIRGPEFRSPRQLLPRRDGPEGARPLDAPWLTRLANRNGQTPCRAALARARAIFEAVASAGAPQTLLLLTDGACNGGAVEPAERWLGALRSHREGRFRFVPLMRAGAGRPDRRLADYARRTGWRGDATVAFDTRALLRAFADVLSFSRGLRYDDGGRVGLERTFAGARSVRALAVRERGDEAIALEIVDARSATPLPAGPTFLSPYGWSVRVARTEPRATPYAVRSRSAGAEVLVIPVYGRLRIEAVVAPCGTRPPLPWDTERAVRAGQPACALARLVGDAGETIVTGESFDFQLEVCADPSCAEATPMQPGEDGTFHAVLGDLPVGRHERAFRASGGALAFPVIERRGFAAVSFGVRQVARAEAPDTPIERVDLGRLPSEVATDRTLLVSGSFPAGARAAVSCRVEGAVAECVRCDPGTAEVALQDRLTLQVRVEASPYCELAASGGPLPVSAHLTLTPTGPAAGALAPYTIPLRGELAYAPIEPIEVEVVGGDTVTQEVEVPAPRALTAVAGAVELDADGLEAAWLGPDRLRADDAGHATARLRVQAAECCTPRTYEGTLRLRAETSTLEVPLRVTVTDPGFWVCPFRRILRWTGAALALLLLLWTVRGFLAPPRFRDGALLLYADTHQRLIELREGDDGYRRLKRFIETKRGFRRPAALHLGGPRAPLPSLKRLPPDGRIEALAGGGAQLVVTGPGVERFSESKGWHELQPGIYPVSSKIQLRRGETYLEFRR